MEVIYTGLHQTPEQIVETVIQEDADAVGLSILSGAHMTLVPRVLELMKERGVGDVVVIVGGTIPGDDIPELKKLGVAEIFTPGASTQEIIDFVQRNTSRQSPADCRRLTQSIGSTCGKYAVRAAAAPPVRLRPDRRQRVREL